MNDPCETSTIPADDHRSIAGTGRRCTVKPLSMLLILIFFLGGCTNLNPIDVDAVTLRERIRSGEAIKPGDTIRAITLDGVAHLLFITAVNDRVIIGYPPGARRDVTETELPIDDIVLVEVSRLSSDTPRRFAKGTAIGAGIGVVVGLIIVVISFP